MADNLPGSSRNKNRGSKRELLKPDELNKIKIGVNLIVDKYFKNQSENNVNPQKLSQAMKHIRHLFKKDKLKIMKKIDFLTEKHETLKKDNKNLKRRRCNLEKKVAEAKSRIKEILGINNQSQNSSNRRIHPTAMKRESQPEDEDMEELVEEVYNVEILDKPVQKNNNTESKGSGILIKVRSPERINQLYSRGLLFDELNISTCTETNESGPLITVRSPDRINELHLRGSI